MHGRDGRRALAGAEGPLKKLLLIAFVTGLLAVVHEPASGQNVSGPWFAPVEVDGRVFPVLRSPRMRWVRWTPNYGEPIYQKQDGKWKQVGKHEGIDVFAETGTPVVAITSGVIQNAGWTVYSGWRVGIRGEDGKYYLYAHLNGIVPGLGERAPVRPGQLVGFVGNSGFGPEGTKGKFPAHLHFGIHSGERWQNPEKTIRRLYNAYVKRTRDSANELARIERQARILKSRAYLPGAPDRAALKRAVDAALKKRVELEASLMTP